jgi:hypothetical protein
MFEGSQSTTTTDTMLRSFILGASFEDLVEKRSEGIDEDDAEKETWLRNPSE